MIIWSSINFPTVICLPTVCYFSREKPLVKPTAPGSLSHIICLCDQFFLPFIFRSIKPKIQKYLAAFYSYLFYLAFDPNLLQIFLTSICHLRRRTPEGIDNPFNTSGCEDLLSVCRGCLCCVAWSPTDLITLVSYLRKIPTAAVW